jgi:hypothetical protein
MPPRLALASSDLAAGAFPELGVAMATDEDDDRDDEQDDEPSTKPTKKLEGGASNTTIYLLVGGGAVLLCCCAFGGAGGVGILFWPQDPVVGRWEGTFTMLGIDVKREVEFNRDGTGTAKNYRVFRPDEVNREQFKYTFTRGNPSTLETEITSAEFGVVVLKNLVGRKDKVDVTFEGDTMTMTSPRLIGGPGPGPSVTYRRVR